MSIAPSRKRNLLLRLHARENGRCFYCDRHVNLHTVETCSTRWPDPRAATLDHVMPRAAGGGNTFDNMVLACFECNNRRGDMSAFDFLAGLQQEAVTC
jgi:5-methylcytosine-specific restriction endonuclease McrA